VISQHLLARSADPGAVALQAGEYRKYVILILRQFGLAELDDVWPAGGAFCLVAPVWGCRLRRELLCEYRRWARKKER
jgi:hypothetical protein